MHGLLTWRVLTIEHHMCKRDVEVVAKGSKEMVGVAAEEETRTLSQYQHQARSLFEEMSKLSSGS